MRLEAFIKCIYYMVVTYSEMLLLIVCCSGTFHIPTVFLTLLACYTSLHVRDNTYHFPPAPTPSLAKKKKKKRNSQHSKCSYFLHSSVVNVPTLLSFIIFLPLCYYHFLDLFQPSGFFHCSQLNLFIPIFHYILLL